MRLWALRARPMLSLVPSKHAVPCSRLCDAAGRRRGRRPQPAERQTPSVSDARVPAAAAAASAQTRRIPKPVPPPVRSWKLVRGDKVEIISGKEKGKRGTILKIYRREQVRQCMVLCDRTPLFPGAAGAGGARTSTWSKPKTLNPLVRCSGCWYRGSTLSSATRQAEVRTSPAALSQKRWAPEP